MIAEISSFQRLGGKYDVMIKVILDGKIIYWSQRIVQDFDINNAEDILSSVLHETEQYLDSLKGEE